MDPLEGSSDLFESVLSGITDEQWQEYKKQRKLEGDFVLDDSDDSSLDDSRPTSPCTFDEKFLAKIQVVHEEEMDVDQDLSDDDFDDDDDIVSSDDGDKNEPTLSWGSDAAVRYVKGDIGFFELAEIMKKSRKSRKRTADGKIKNDNESPDAKSKKARNRRRKTYELPKEFGGLMGTANLCFAKGDTDRAIQICLELIRQAPSAQEPYQTLGMIYEETGDMKQSLQCSLLAAYLNPIDTEEWIRLAGLSLEQQQIQQAIKCYSFAIRNEPENINFLWERCNLYEILGDRKNSLTSYERILQALNKPEDAEKCVEISREVAKVHHDNEDVVNAIKVLETAFTKFPSLITSEDVNFLLELQITKRSYKAALKNFVQHCGVILHIGDEEICSYESMDNYTEEQIKEIHKCQVPDVLPIDLQVKLLVCLIHLEALKSIDELIASLKQESVEDMGDLYLDVAEALMCIKQYASCIPLLTALISSEKYNLAAVWLKYGDCLNNLCRGKEASEAYETVLKMAPSYQEARMSLSRILIENGKKQEAANALKQEYEEGKLDSVLDLQVLIERCGYLYELERFEEFIKAARLVQYSHCIPLVTNEEFQCILSNQSCKRRYDALKDMPSIVNRPRPLFHPTSSSIDVTWSVFQKLCSKLYEMQRLKELQNICLETLSSTLWRKDVTIFRTAETFALMACLYNKSHKYAYSFIKDVIFKNLHCNRAWNLLCLNVTQSQQVRHNRFCLRLLIKNQAHTALALFNGHCAMNSGSYKHALGLYFSILERNPDDPVALFFTGITYVHMACQKFATKRYLLIAQAIAFLRKYMDIRCDNQESLYNMGRAFHQLGIKDAAVIYYKKALCAPPVVSQSADMETFDLKHEIALNLSLIYQSSGSNALASTFLRTYNVV